MLIGISGYIGSGKDTLGNMLRYQMYLKKRENDKSNFNDNNIMPWEAFARFPSGEGMPSIGSNTLSGMEIRKFGYALKQIVSILTGATLSQLEDQEFKKKELLAIWNRSVKEAREWLNLRDKDNWLWLNGSTDEQIIKYANERNFKWTRTYREMMQEIGTEVMRNHFVDDIWVNALMGKYNTNILSIDKDGYEHPIYPNWIITDMRFPNEAKAIKEAGGLLIRIDGLPRVSNHPSEISLDNYQEFDGRVLNYYK